MNKKKICINATRINKGGGLQYTNSILKELKNYDLNVTLLINKKLLKLLTIPDNIICVTISDTSFIIYLIKIHIFIIKNKFDVIFSVFGPSYLYLVRSKHIVGFATGWAINLRSVAYLRLDLKSRVFKYIESIVKLISYFFESKKFIAESNLVRNKIKVIFRNSNVFVVSNTSQFYNGNIYKKSIADSPSKIIYVANGYPHKNHSLLFEIAKLQTNILFYVTLTNEEFTKYNELGLSNVINLGNISGATLETYYKLCDIAFIPTLLESFSASYVEAMNFSLSILTTDFDFSNEICGSSAFYFRHDDLNDLNYKINYLTSIKSKNVREKKVLIGHLTLEKFGTPKKRIQKIIKIIESL